MATLSLRHRIRCRLRTIIREHTSISVHASHKNVGNTAQAVHDHKWTTRGWTQQAYQIGRWNWDCSERIGHRDVTYFTTVLSDFSCPYAIRPMNFNVESVPHGYLPDYQDNLYSPPPQFLTLRRWKRTYNIRIQDGKNHVLTQSAHQKLCFTSHWHNLLKLHQIYFKIVTRRRNELSVTDRTTLTL